MSAPKEYAVPTPSHWPAVIEALLQQAQGVRLWCLLGDLGMGKTTLVKALAHHLGSTDRISSPSFALVHTYHTQGGDPLYHMDLYRLENPRAMAALGLEEYFHTGAYCFIEWAEKIIPYLEPPYFTLHIQSAGEGRLLTAQRKETPVGKK